VLHDEVRRSRKESAVRNRLKAAVAAAVVVVGSGVAVATLSSPAEAHGAMMKVGSRPYLCYLDGQTPQGSIGHTNSACIAARAVHGDYSHWNWFGELQSAGAGRTRGYLPDGQICGGNNANFSGFNLGRNDFPYTRVTAGANFKFEYNNWAKHPGTFYLYVTNNNYNPSRPLTWNDIEAQPFASVTDPTSIGGPGTLDGRYEWTSRLPTGKSGKHIIFSVWSRSDSLETFYNCSDVSFDGGNGEVVGVKNPPDPGPGPGPGPSPGACSGTFEVVGSNSGSWQGRVTVRNSGSAAVNGWTVSWPQTQAITSLWNASYTHANGTVTAKNLDWNAAVAANGSVNFGFNGSGSAPSPAPAVTCSSP
jgi:predicted carbohydrate-binding protein with CBM5 and CBM33 domain